MMLPYSSWRSVHNVRPWGITSSHNLSSGWLVVSYNPDIYITWNIRSRLWWQSHFLSLLKFLIASLNSSKYCHTGTKYLLVCGNVVLIHLPISIASSKGLWLQNGRRGAQYVVNAESNSFDCLSHCLAVHTSYSAIPLLWEKYRLL